MQQSGLCDVCKAAPPVVDLTELSETGTTTHLDLCPYCACKRAMNDPNLSSLADLLNAIFPDIPLLMPPTEDSPAAVVQRQLDAYNAKNIEALLETYAPNARQFEHPDKLLATGTEELRRRFVTRFEEPHLHARLLKRIVLGDYVIDHEEVTRSFPEGRGKVQLVAIYLVEAGKIAQAWFITGPKTLDLS